MLVVYRPGPEFLVALRTPERHGYWNLVAGGVEKGEAPAAAARRELVEESGLADPVAFEQLPLELGYLRPGGPFVVLHAYSAAAPAWLGAGAQRGARGISLVLGTRGGGAARLPGAA